MKNEKNNMNHDERINAFGRDLRKLELPTGLRESNQQRIRKAMDILDADSTSSVSWYRRGLQVSYPMAAGFLLIFCLQAVFLTYNLTGGFSGDAEGKGQVNQKSTIDRSENSGEPYYSEQGVYVAGMGFVEKSVTYYRMENSYDNEKD